ncbi:MAG: hypothetical protein OHK0015_40060 [Chloroflexi bacterium OHK40]
MFSPASRFSVAKRSATCSRTAPRGRAITAISELTFFGAGSQAFRNSRAPARLSLPDCHPLQRTITLPDMA